MPRHRVPLFTVARILMSMNSRIIATLVPATVALSHVDCCCFSGDEDASGSFQEGLIHGVDVAVAVKDGDGKGLEVWAAPGD